MKSLAPPLRLSPPPPPPPPDEEEEEDEEELDEAAALLELAEEEDVVALEPKRLVVARKVERLDVPEDADPVEAEPVLEEAVDAEEEEEDELLDWPPPPPPPPRPPPPPPPEGVVTVTTIIPPPPPMDTVAPPPPPGREPRSCGAMIEANFSAVVTPVSRKVRWTLPMATTVVRTLARPPGPPCLAASTLRRQSV
jgi:hypothetical protein